MDYKAVRDRIEEMANNNHRDFVKAIICIEKGINDESVLDKLYNAYMDNDSLNLLHEEFDFMITSLREQGNMKRDLYNWKLTYMIFKKMRVSEMSEKHREIVGDVGEILENCRRYVGIRCWEVVNYFQFFNYPQ